MKNYFKKFSIVFLILLAIMGIQDGISTNAVTIGERLTAPEEGWRRYDDNENKIVFSANFFIRIDNWGYYNNTVHGVSCTATSSVKFSFYGTKLRLYEHIFSNRNHNTRISLDDGKTFEPCSSYGTDSPSAQRLYYEKAGLKKEVHSVIIEIPVDEQQYFGFDCFDIDKDGYLVSYDESILLKKSALNLTEGNSELLTAITTPEGVGVSWASSDTSVATVDSNGKITAIKAGTATITATTTDGSNLSATCEVTVTKPVSKIELNKTSDILQVGQEDNLVASITPEDATNKNVTWASSDTSVVTVDSDGKVTAVKAGTATITATTTDRSNLSATCEVTVTQLASKIELNKTEDSLKVGQEDQLVATVIPDYATNKNVTWTSSDTSIAAVDSTGKITALKAGTVTITATTDGSNLSATCAVTVTNPSVDSTWDRAKLTIFLVDRNVMEYDLSKDELNNFLKWHALAKKGIGDPYYIFVNKGEGEYVSNETYIECDKITFFRISKYKAN